MRESPWYNEILRQGAEEQAIEMILRQLRRRVGTLAVDLQVDEITALSLDQLGQLGDALLDFTTSTDLAEWLAAQRSDR